MYWRARSNTLRRTWDDFPCVGDYVFFMLPSRMMVIDTSGMRELGLFGTDDGISAAFNEVGELYTQCRFNAFRHQTEPGCAVLPALTDESLAREHWERYLS
ncbi:hypothetical protein [Paenibacillus pinihumi]|uniref:hypothetical protein n=1 Tax=Paenibacillus pinihumi TaxID=669462 RepID=UPI0012B56161|nr:hypothetical protein [Paenibacillus pinihumi]